MRIFNRNTKALVEAVVQTPGGAVVYDGGASIDGVAGTAAPVKLTFLRALGSKTGTLLPSGAPLETIEGLTATLIDYAMPMLLLRADELGIAGDEPPGILDGDSALLARIESARREAGRRMGLGDVSKLVVPKVGLLSAPRHGGTLTSRYFVPDRCHRAHAVTGALCVAAASRLPGTVAFDLAAAGDPARVTIEHPSGRIDVDVTADASGTIERASLIRTVRRIFRGKYHHPGERLGADAGSARRFRRVK